jgi:hypothetical protein
MRCTTVVAFILLAAIEALGCDFEYDPASATQFYRAEGWKLPGTEDFTLSAHPSVYGLPFPRQPIQGARFRILSHDETPYVVELPPQTFLLNGIRHRMRAAQFKASILRWTVNDRVVAYSYGLIPVDAHRENNKWIIENEVACIFDATFIDDKGDGVFRILVPGLFAADLVPGWARIQKN